MAPALSGGSFKMIPFLWTLPQVGGEVLAQPHSGVAGALHGVRAPALTQKWPFILLWAEQLQRPPFRAVHPTETPLQQALLENPLQFRRPMTYEAHK